MMLGGLERIKKNVIDQNQKLERIIREFEAALKLLLNILIIKKIIRDTVKD